MVQMLIIGLIKSIKFWGKQGGVVESKSSSYSIYKFKNCFFLFIYEMIDVN